MYFQLEYFKQGKRETFVFILESSCLNASIDYENYQKDQIKAMNLLAAYYVQEARRDTNVNKKKEYFARASLLYVNADKIDMFNKVKSSLYHFITLNANCTKYNMYLQL